MLRTVLVLLVALLVVGCASQEATPTTQPTQADTGVAVTPAGDAVATATRPQFLNSFASW